MTPRIPRVLPAAPVDVPHYAPRPGDAPVPELVRADGHTPFDPAELSAAERDAAQDRARGALLGLVAVPANVASGPANVNGRVVALAPLRPAGADGFTVCGVYDPPAG